MSERINKDPDEYAKENGLRVVYPTAHTLLIDIDSDADLKVFKENLVVLQEHFEVKWSWSPSRRKAEGKHIIVKIEEEEFTFLERLGLQAMLGSDRKRELLSFFDGKSFLFEKK
jgi:hypothetical protein